MNATWPPLIAYALARRCPTCHTEPGADCNAPNKASRFARADHIAAQAGVQIEHNPLDRMHKTRQQAGARHYRRDVGNAPWPEDREPGKRYDTLGDAWSPE